MKTKKLFAFGIVAVVAMMVLGSGCTGSSSPDLGAGNSNGTNATGATAANLQQPGATLLAAVAGSRSRHIGEIERFGSIFVNGMEIETNDASISVDNKSGVENDLKVGMRVNVEVQLGDDKKLHATNVRFNDDVHGVIDSDDAATFKANLATGMLKVMGQTIKMDDQTAFHDCGVSDLQPGQIVQLSGARDGQGVIHATMVARKSMSFDALPAEQKEVETKGFLANLNADAKTFTLGTLTVDYAGAVLDTGITSAGGLAEGMYIEARSGEAPVNGLMVASTISLEDQSLGLGEEARIKGLITGVASTNDFVVDGRSVRTSVDTIFKNGAPSDVAVGRLVEVEGSVDSAGILVAREISFELASNIKLQWVVLQAVDVSAQTVKALGIEVAVNSSTRLQDESAAEIRNFTLADLNVGDRLCIRAVLDSASGTVVAAKLDRDKTRSDGRVMLQGLLDPDASTAAVFVILGTLIDTSTIVKFESLTAAHLPDAAAFLQAAKDLADARKLVKVQGTLQADGSVRWDRAELEVEHQFQNEVQNEFEFEFETEAGFQNPIEHPVEASQGGGGGGGGNP